MTEFTCIKRNDYIIHGFFGNESEEFMITLSETKRFGVNRNVLSMVGLSDDEKPIKEIEGMTITNGSSLYCMDTKTIYIFDEENQKWHEQ